MIGRIVGSHIRLTVDHDPDDGSPSGLRSVWLFRRSFRERSELLKAGRPKDGSRASGSFLV